MMNHQGLVPLGTVKSQITYHCHSTHQWSNIFSILDRPVIFNVVPFQLIDVTFTYLRFLAWTPASVMTVSTRMLMFLVWGFTN